MSTFNGKMTKWNAIRKKDYLQDAYIKVTSNEMEITSEVLLLLLKEISLHFDP